MLTRRSQQGDTMIEVLLSITIFSLVAVMGLTIMNQGTASAQRSLEISLVRQEMETQAEALRFMYDDAIAQRSSAGYNPSVAPPANTAAARWNQVLATRSTAATSFGSMTSSDGTCIPAPGSTGSTSGRSFVINPRSAAPTLVVANKTSQWTPSQVYSRVLYNADTTIKSVEGLWVEGVKVDAKVVNGSAVPGYTDFHIRACWASVGQARSLTLGTIVRLYEP